MVPPKPRTHTKPDAYSILELHVHLGETAKKKQGQAALAGEVSDEEHLFLTQ